MMKRGLIFGAFLMVLGACNESEKGVQEKVKSNVERRLEMIAEVDSMESAMQKDNLNPGSPTASELLKTYVKFSELYPGDKEKSPEYLYKAAALSRAVKLPVKAIKLYDQILSRYPNWEKAPEVAFLIAFTYDEDINSPDLAEEAYRKVMEDFPGDHWAVQAEQRLATIHMSDEDLIEYFQNKAGENSAQSGT